MTFQKRTTLKYILLGGVKKTESAKVETMAKKVKAKKKHAKTKAMKMADMKAEVKSDKSNEESANTGDEKWDVMNPPGDKREIDINVTEGTWMSLDVSPDGKTIAFDMLGDIRASHPMAPASPLPLTAQAEITSGQWMLTAATWNKSRKKHSVF